MKVIIDKLIIKKSSIQNKLLSSYLLLIIISLGIFGFLSLSISEYIIKKEISESNLKTLYQVSDKIEIVLDEITSVSDKFYLNSDLCTILTSGSRINLEVDSTEIRRINDMFINYLYAFGWLKCYASVTGFNGKEFHSYAGEKLDMNKIQEEQWYDEVVKKDGRIVWVSDSIINLTPISEERDFFSAVRFLKDPLNGNKIGMLVISVDGQSFQRLYKSALKEYESMIIVDERGTIISSQNKSLIRSNIDEIISRESAFKGSAGYSIGKVNSKDFLITYHTVSRTGWRLIAFTPLDKLLKNITILKIIVISLLLFCILIALGMSYLVSKRLSIDIRTLYNDIKNIEMGNLSVRSKVDSNDEIGELARRFNIMVEKIELLMSRVKYEEKMKQRMEYRFLQAQINPHFLYNTLASIRFMLGTKEPEIVDSVIVALVKLLKRTFSSDSGVIPIYEEIDNIKNYIYIHEVRQSDKLEVKYEIDENILEYKILKFTLQPLVENAIFHGITPLQGKGIIIIRGYKDKDDIVFEVIDNGIGFNNDTDLLQHTDIRNKELKMFSGVGIKNVHDRIVMNFGSGYGLKIGSLPGKGTCVKINIPAFFKEEEMEKS